MSRNEQESKAIRDNLTGHNVAAAVPVPELIAISGGDIRDRFNSLDNDDQRQGFLESIIGKMDSNWGNWAKFYEAVSILREQESFWRNLGFDTFDNFWRVTAGPSFQSFKELEEVYNFAKTACPEMFGINFEGARKLINDLETLKIVPALGPHGAIKRSYSGEKEASAAAAQAMTWKNAGGNSIEYKLAKIKRDRPDIAARVLAGEFFKTLGTGQVGIDLVAAEREAYGEVVRKVKPKAGEAENVGVKMAQAIRSAAKTPQSRQKIINELKNISWLTEGLAKAK